MYLVPHLEMPAMCNTWLFDDCDFSFRMRRVHGYSFQSFLKLFYSPNETRNVENMKSCTIMNDFEWMCVLCIVIPTALKLWHIAPIYLAPQVRLLKLIKF